MVQKTGGRRWSQFMTPVFGACISLHSPWLINPLVPLPLLLAYNAIEIYDLFYLLSCDFTINIYSIISTV